jgi:hypothetical protein
VIRGATLASVQGLGGGLVPHLTVTGGRAGVLALGCPEPVVLRQLIIEDVWAVGAGTDPTAGPVELDEVVTRRVNRQSNGHVGLGV